MLLLSYNIQYGFGSDGICDLARAAGVIDGADLIALQEVDRHWQRSGDVDQPALLERLLPQYYTAFAPAFDMDASTRARGRITNRRRQFGPMILSRWPILWTRLHLLPMRRMLAPLNTQTAALEACVAAPGGPLRVFSLHLAHVGVAERLDQIDHLSALLARAPVAGPPWSGTDDEPVRNWTNGQPEPPNPSATILMGDFNCEPGSAEMGRLLGQSPYHPGARYAQGLVDVVAQAAAPGASPLHTHEKVIDGRMRQRRLDHILMTPELAARAHSARTDPGQIASDHFPLWVTLDLE